MGSSATPNGLTPEEFDDACLKAYEYWCEGMSQKQIWQAMQGSPYFCGGTTTARRWKDRGMELYAASEGDFGRKAQRYRKLSRLDARYQDVLIAIRTGQASHELAAMYRILTTDLEEQYTRLFRLDAKPHGKRIEMSGQGGGYAYPPELAATLHADDDEKDE